LAALAQRALSRGAQPPTAARAAAASGTAAVSGMLAAAAARELRGQGTTLDPIDPTRASVLVTTGANAVSRNPMYVGLAGLLVANAVRRGSWTALLPVAAFVLAIDRVQIMSEEGALLARFGSDYEAYRAAVPRWLDRRSLTAIGSLTAGRPQERPLPADEDGVHGP
jgi:protein-S-isoprenylcysteine O-methyltransferase Ste14